MAMRISFAAVVLALALLPGATLAAAGAQNPPAPGAAPSRPQMTGMMNMNMMKMHEQMMAEMQANDAKLDALATALNGAKGDARIDALVAAVNELARQHKAERAHMNEMHQMMMRSATSPSPEPSAHVH
jgi:hypothetical protein